MDNERVISIDDHGCYLLTLETVDLIDLFIRPVYKQLIVHTLNHYITTKGLIVYGWCLMPSRLYLICQPQKNASFKELRKSFKQFTTEKIMATIYNEPEERQWWLVDHFQKSSGFLGTQKKIETWKKVKEIISIDQTRPENMAEHLAFIHNMPVQERMVRYPSDFIYSSALDYETGSTGLVKITRPSAVEAAVDDIENRKSLFKTKLNRR